MWNNRITGFCVRFTFLFNSAEIKNKCKRILYRDRYRQYTLIEELLSARKADSAWSLDSCNCVILLFPRICNDDFCKLRNFKILHGHYDTRKLY